MIAPTMRTTASCDESDAVSSIIGSPAWAIVSPGPPGPEAGAPQAASVRSTKGLARAAERGRARIMFGS